ncbi:uncharacterized protein N7477_010060 [Penicillium maclennaniae]|uniref:uncharacterized protein n=1 Tax=Penicillium maclennaniae TaxID=1343394 RepID=UPI0025400764|nr:uncharacterized protein N7477_010060 [Penicillium maclennaniae]KAJ5662444.1 hypothetical protein N7477_010060 [Penicillium maclennaniae]
MSLSSRGAITRNLRLDAIRLPSRAYSRYLTPTLQPRVCSTRTLSSINFLNIEQKTTTSHRAFSTTRFLQSEISAQNLVDILPVCCPGCGAFSQTIEPNEPGYYGKTRKQRRKPSKKDNMEQQNAEAENVAISNAQDSSVSDIGDLAGESTAPKPIQGGALPEEWFQPATRNSAESQKQLNQVCDRCHDLIHHNKAVSAPKPTILSIREFLNESPYKDNCVYHILDAADFPMSLIPRIHQALSLQEQRSRNRRAANEKYIGGKKLATLNFIITRSDLLAATKDQVDSKMEYVRSILRESLGKAGKDVRLGNVHMISAHRGWWTKQVKEEIYKHGGGIWVVGKANLHRSLLSQEFEDHGKHGGVDSPTTMLPVISSLPGTTVSPIRIPFGRGKGEVIDLPGLERGQLEDFVRDDHKRDLIMVKRVKPERCTIKPGQSLLLGGGLVRITPVNSEDTVLAACFVPIESHITKTDKAIEIQAEQRPYPGKILMKEGTGSSITSAGKFDLEWDITASNLPALVAKAVKDKKIPIPPLPYRVMSADILIEGCGWVEISVQCLLPKGKHIGFRPPIECWNFIAEKKKADKRKRPRLRYRYS